MNEKILKKRIFRFTTLIGIGSSFFVICAIIMLMSIKQTDQKSYDTYIYSMIDEYKLRFQSEINTDINSLQIISDLIVNGLLAGAGAQNGFAGTLPEGTQFEDMQYYDMDALKEMNESGDGDKIFPDEVKEIIANALSEESCVSQPYYKENKNMLAYAVPVSDEGERQGVLLASKSAERLFQIFEEETLAKLQLNILWIKKNGEILTSEPYETEEGKMNIYQMGEISRRERNWIEVCMGNNRSCTSKAKIEGQEHKMYLTPMDINGWYMAYIDDSGAGIQSPVYSTIIVVSGIFLIIIILSGAAIAYTYRLTKENSRQLIRLSDYDRITGIYNINRFCQETQEASEGREDFCMATLDIRHYAYVNEIFGRSEAERLLCEVASILKANLKEGEFCCRHAKSRYYMVMYSTDAEEIRDRLEMIGRRAGELSRHFQKKVPIVLYWGVCVKEAEDDEQEMIRKADFALESIRNYSEELVAFYNLDMHNTEKFQRFIESIMYTALKEEEYQLYLQPKKNLSTGIICGAEALVRWIRPDGTRIFPDQFIPLFEQNGFCAELDLYMMEQVCRLERKWIDERGKGLAVSVNQSKLLFYKEDYVQRLCELTDKYQIPRELIVLEILEGLAAENIEGLNETIRHLKREGFQVSLDDFGSGYSTLNILSGIEVDEIKLDRGFLLQKEVADKEKQGILMKHIINLAKDFKVRTVAEGVETEESEAFLREIGCDYGQGYLYSRPIPAEEFEDLFFRAVF